MKRYLLISMESATFTEVVFQNPRVINELWYGDSQLHAYPKSLLFPEEDRDILEKICCLLKQAKRKF